MSEYSAYLEVKKNILEHNTIGWSMRLGATCTEASRPHFNGNSQAQSASIPELWASLSTTVILPLLNTRAK